MVALVMAIDRAIKASKPFTGDLLESIRKLIFILTRVLQETYGIPPPFCKGVPDVYERATTSLWK